MKPKARWLVAGTHGASTTGMDRSKRSDIDIVEAAYDLQLGPRQWLPNLLEAGGEALDKGLGCAAALWAGVSNRGEPLIAQLHVPRGPADLALRFMRAAKEVESLVPVRTREARGGVSLVSEGREGMPEVYEAITKHVGCEDVLGIWALDPDLHGIGINVPCPEVLRLSFRARQHWEMLAIHIATGHRLRRGLGRAGNVPGTPVSEIPLDGDALLDPRRFSVAEAAREAREPSSLELIRQAAIRRDQARGKLRRTDPDKALALWEGMVRGRWSLVDWFDTDGRRYILAKANPPHLGDPRGLTEREHQVATFAALGESHKIIAYRLGIASSRVCTLLHSAMRKLGVRTQAQLVMRMRAPKISPSDLDRG